MARLALAGHIRWLAMAVVLLLLMTPPATATAARHTDDGDVNCDRVSTSNLVITATNAGNDGPRLTLTVQTGKYQDPGRVNGNWNVVFRANVEGTPYVLDRWDIHKVFLIDHESEGSATAMQEDDCSGGDEDTCDEGGSGDCGGEEGDCGGDDGGCSEGGCGNTGGTTVAIRGQGYFNGSLDPVPFQMNLTDNGNDPGKPDVVKVRWQSPNHEEQVHSDADSCEGGGWVTHSWLTIENVQQVNIHQLKR